MLITFAFSMICYQIPALVRSHSSAKMILDGIYFLGAAYYCHKAQSKLSYSLHYLLSESMQTQTGLLLELAAGQKTCCSSGRAPEFCLHWTGKTPLMGRSIPMKTTICSKPFSSSNYKISREGKHPLANLSSERNKLLNSYEFF